MEGAIVLLLLVVLVALCKWDTACGSNGIHSIEGCIPHNSRTIGKDLQAIRGMRKLELANALLCEPALRQG